MFRPRRAEGNRLPRLRKNSQVRPAGRSSVIRTLLNHRIAAKAKGRNAARRLGGAGPRRALPRKIRGIYAKPKGEKRIQAFITQFDWCEWMVASHGMATRTEKINRFRRLSILLTVSRRPSEIAVGAVGRGERRVHGDHFVAGTIANSIVTATSRLGGRSLD